MTEHLNHPSQPVTESHMIDLKALVQQELSDKLVNNPQLVNHVQETKWISDVIVRFIDHPKTKLWIVTAFAQLKNVQSNNSQFRRTRIFAILLAICASMTITLLSRLPTRDQLVDEFFDKYEQDSPECFTNIFNAAEAIRKGPSS